MAHNEPTGVAASAQAYTIHVLAHLKDKIVQFLLSSGEDRRFGQFYLSRHQHRTCSWSTGSGFTNTNTKRFTLLLPTLYIHKTFTFQMLCHQRFLNTFTKSFTSKITYILPIITPKTATFRHSIRHITTLKHVTLTTFFNKNISTTASQLSTSNLQTFYQLPQIFKLSTLTMLQRHFRHLSSSHRKIIIITLHSLNACSLLKRSQGRICSIWSIPTTITTTLTNTFTNITLTTKILT
jgi:hypothetical protein